MSNREGLVLSADSEQATIVIIRESACGGNCGMCGAGCNQKYTMTVKNTQQLQTGDRVFLLASTFGILFLAFISYILPLLLAMIVYAATGTDAGAVFTLLLGFILGTLFANVLAQRPFFKTKIIKKQGDIAHEHL